MITTPHGPKGQRCNDRRLTLCATTVSCCMEVIDTGCQHCKADMEVIDTGCQHCKQDMEVIDTGCQHCKPDMEVIDTGCQHCKPDMEVIDSVCQDYKPHMEVIDTRCYWHSNIMYRLQWQQQHPVSIYYYIWVTYRGCKC